MSLELSANDGENYVKNVPATLSSPKASNSRQIYIQKLIPAMKFIALSSVGITTLSSAALASTYFDTDVYGDKELKIATVNKLKQKLRNAILNDITLASDFLKLSINDALGYDVATEDGGPDGSILFEMKQPGNENLQKAVNVILGIKKELLRTNTVSFADIVAFAGAEALETVGSSRIIVQVGRFDAKFENKKTKIVPWNDLSNSNNIIDAFKSSGLDEKDIVLLLCGLGEINRVINESLSKNNNKIESDDDDDFEEQPFVPTTFGARDAMYGAKIGLGDFSTKYISNILKKPDDNDSYANILLNDIKLKAILLKYNKNDVVFIKDVSESYLKMTLLGGKYTTRNS
eukprot:gene10643-14295_t